MNKEATNTVESKIVKAHCPKCDGEHNCAKHGTIYKAWDWADKYSGHSTNGGVDHLLLECLGCNAVFYQTESWNSEEIYPYYDATGETQYEVSKSPSEK
jgi:hypothetical protein